MSASETTGAPSPWREAIRLLRPFWQLTVVMSAIGVAGGLATGVLLAEVNRGLQGSQPVSGADDWARYRSLLSGVFADYSLFEHLPSNDRAAEPEGRQSARPAGGRLRFA